VARRARLCLQHIKTATSPEVLGAAIEVLALRRPAGAVEALLGYVPAADRETGREVRAALAELVRAAGKPDPALLRALEDGEPARRAAAVAVLGKDGGAWLKEPGRRLYFQPPLHAMKTIAHRDGKLYMELETHDVQNFNAFEEKVFARPRGR
jgi:hypothetical protein